MDDRNLEGTWWVDRRWAGGKVNSDGNAEIATIFCT